MAPIPLGPVNGAAVASAPAPLPKIFTQGAAMYPEPALVTEMPVTTPLTTVAVAVAP